MRPSAARATHYCLLGRLLGCLLGCLLIAVAASASPSAQADTAGQVTGQITDMSGGTLPGAAVTITSLATGAVAATTVSDGDGYYTSPRLPPGRYRIDVQMDGFALATQDTPDVTAGSLIRLDIVLDLGRAVEQVTVTAHAVSGTRFGAKLVETPYSIQVLTSDFIEDFQLFESADQLRFVSGAFSGAEDTGANNGKRLRGFEPPVLRDGFSRANPADRTMVERVEIIRGPVSTLYGQSSPGGLINYVSKRPTSEPRYSATLTYGSYKFMPVAFEAAGPIRSGKLFYFANYSRNRTESDLAYFFNDKQLFALGLTYAMSPKTSMTFSWERQVIDSNQGDTIPVFRQGSFTAGIRWDLAKYNIQGPYNDLSRNFQSGNVLIEHRVAANLTARVNLQVYDRDFDEQQYRYGAGNTVQPGGTMTAEAFLQTQKESAYLGQMDLLWRKQMESVSHAFLGTADFSRYTHRNRTFVRPPVRTSATVNRRPTFDINPDDPLWVDVPRGEITQVFQDTDRKINTGGAFASHRAFLFDNRLVTLAGLRYDRVSSPRLLSVDATRVASANDQTPVISLSDGSGSTEDAVSYTLGANLKLPDDRFVWFVNHSTGFEPKVTIDNGTHRVVPNERSRGFETGIKGSPFEGRLGYTLSVFRIDKTDVAIANPDYDPSAVDSGPQFIASGAEEANGAEAEFRWNLTRSLFIQGGGAYIDGEVTVPTAQRDRLLKSPRGTGYAAARYVFRDGRLKGWRAGTSLTYTGDYVFNAGSATRFRQIHPAVTLYNAFIGYRWSSGALRHNVALNGFNLSDKTYLQDTFRLARGREVRLTYTLTR